jgi:hypothetical protein
VNPEQLQHLLDRMGAVRIGGTNYCRCPNCQPAEDDPEKYRLVVSPGRHYPVVAFCHRCMIPKPVSEEDRAFNRQVVRRIWCDAVADVDPVYVRMSEGEVRTLWGAVTVGGKPVREADDRAPDAVLHIHYSSLLSSLTLSDRHRKWLAKRGLDPDWCYERGYRTADGPVPASTSAEGVPGLVDGRWLTRKSLLIPCRDRNGLVGAVKMRLTSDGRSRMRLLSGGGVKAKQMIHFPEGVRLDGRPLWITEGERKADAVYFHYGQPVGGLPGVGFANRAVELSVSAQSVVLALDDDDAGRRCTQLLGTPLRQRNVDVLVARWPDGFKGIDDALAAGQKVEVEEWTGPERTKETPSTLTPQPTVSTRFQKGQKLRDDQVLPYIREMGPVLRSEVLGYQPLISDLIRRNLVKMTKTAQGQQLEAADATDAGV